MFRDRKDAETSIEEQLDAELGRAKKEEEMKCAKSHLYSGNDADGSPVLLYPDSQPPASLRSSFSTPEARSRSRDTQIMEHMESTESDRAKRERLRDEVWVAHQVQDSASGLKREEEPRLGQGLKKDTATVNLEEVVVLAEQFETLFDLGTVFPKTQRDWPSTEVQYQASPHLRSDEEDLTDSDRDGTSGSAWTDELRRQDLRGKNARETRVYKIRNKIEHLREKYERYLDEGRFAEAQDLGDHAIPLQLELLEKEHVNVLPNRARNRGYQCDACHFWIPGFRYHCGKCQGSSGSSPEEGTWDICEECWNTGARCPESDVHEMVLVHD